MRRTTRSRGAHRPRTSSAPKELTSAERPWWRQWVPGATITRCRPAPAVSSLKPPCHREHVGDTLVGPGVDEHHRNVDAVALVDEAPSVPARIAKGRSKIVVVRGRGPSGRTHEVAYRQLPEVRGAIERRRARRSPIPRTVIDEPAESARKLEHAPLEDAEVGVPAAHVADGPPGTARDHRAKGGMAEACQGELGLGGRGTAERADLPVPTTAGARSSRASRRRRRPHRATEKAPRPSLPTRAGPGRSPRIPRAANPIAAGSRRDRSCDRRGGE
jgi:hypothetical protein